MGIFKFVTDFDRIRLSQLNYHSPYQEVVLLLIFDTDDLKGLQKWKKAIRYLK